MAKRKPRKKKPRKGWTASEMAKKRWKDTTADERSEHARRMADTRWRKTPRKKD